MQTRLFFRFLFILFLVIGCTSEEKSAAEQRYNLNRFEEHVVQVSQGIISAQSDVRIVLTEPVRGWNKGGQLDTDLLEVSPIVKRKVSGKRWFHRTF